MTRRASGFARAFAGRWRITETGERDEIGLPGSAHVTFGGKNGGEPLFIAIEADLDMRDGARDGAACAEFSEEGFDDGTSTSGRGWAAMGTAGRLVGHIFIHKGDDAGFLAERERLLQRRARPPNACRGAGQTTSSGERVIRPARAAVRR